MFLQQGVPHDTTPQLQMKDAHMRIGPILWFVIVYVCVGPGWFSMERRRVRMSL